MSRLDPNKWQPNMVRSPDQGVMKEPFPPTPRSLWLIASPCCSSFFHVALLAYKILNYAIQLQRFCYSHRKQTDTDILGYF